MNMTTPPPELLALSERAEFDGNTGIYVRAKFDGKWGSHDIAELSGDSLLAWLRADGGCNPLAENTLLTLFNHEQVARRPEATTPNPELPESVVTDDWTEGVKFAVREMAKHPVAFCTDKMVEITAKLIVDAAVKEKQSRASESVRAANARAEGVEADARSNLELAAIRDLISSMRADACDLNHIRCSTVQYWANKLEQATSRKSVQKVFDLSQYEDIGCLREGAQAFEAVVLTLNELFPEWGKFRTTGSLMERTVAMIRRIAKSSPNTPHGEPAITHTKGQDNA